MTRTTVIIHPGGLGDLLLAVPAIRRIHARFPHHERVLCANEPAARLFVQCGIIDAWISTEGRACADLFEQGPSASGYLGKWLARCDCVVAWMQDHDGHIAEGLRKSGAREVIVASPFSVSLRRTHQSDRFCEILQAPPVDFSLFEPLVLPADFRGRGRSCLEEVGIHPDRPFIVVHPGSGSPRKSVGIEPMASVLTQLHDRDLAPLVVEGPADREATEQLCRRIPFDIPVARNLELGTLVAMLSYATLYIGHDSGVSHLSALLGVRTVVLFASTDPHRWAPRGIHVTVLKGTLSSERLMAEILPVPTGCGS